MTDFVYLVMTPDRQVIDVCLDQESAEHFAHIQGADAEKWPVSRTPRMGAWNRALTLAPKRQSDGARS